MTTSTAALTAAFNAGVAARNDGKGLSARFDVAKGKPRDFWEAGWHKADKAARDAFNSPEAVAARAAKHQADVAAARARRDAMQDAIATSEVDAMLAGRTLTRDDRIRIACNAAIGLTTKF